MGRFETAAEFYRFREPYPPVFFETMAQRLGLTEGSRLLDVGCGPGNLAIGFAPFAPSCTAIDREPAMLKAARAAAAEAGADVKFIEARVEDFEGAEKAFDLVTIGRALHWLARDATLTVLDRALASGGHIAICGTTASETESDAPVNAWTSKFKEVRRAWASEPDESRYHVDLDQWFSRSPFERVDEISVKYRQRVTIPELIGRALSFSITSPAVVGERRQEFATEMRKALEPFATEGVLDEELTAKGTIFGRVSRR